MAEVAENTLLAPVNLTDGAVKALDKIRTEERIPDDHFLRVGVKGGGCSGFTYVLGFDLKKEGDQEYLINGQQVVMQKAHQLYLLGITIDWEDGLNNRGFTFNNPNAKDTCGCGTSFSA
jgi:iron-sulfur cluster assembly protein